MCVSLFDRKESHEGFQSADRAFLGERGITLLWRWMKALFKKRNKVKVKGEAMRADVRAFGRHRKKKREKLPRVIKDDTLIGTSSNVQSQ